MFGNGLCSVRYLYRGLLRQLTSHGADSVGLLRRQAVHMETAGADRDAARGAAHQFRRLTAQVFILVACQIQYR